MKSIKELSNSDYFNEASTDLIIKVIKQAVKDTKDNRITQILREDAKVWLKGEICKMYCELLGLSHREIIKKAGVN